MPTGHGRKIYRGPRVPFSGSRGPRTRSYFHTMLFLFPLNFKFFENIENEYREFT